MELVLLTGSGLLIESFARLTQTALGFSSAKRCDLSAASAALKPLCDARITK